MSDNTLLVIGVVGTFVSAILSFTPVLAELSRVNGLAAIVDYYNVILLPVLAGFTGITFYALWRRQQNLNSPV